MKNKDFATIARQLLPAPKGFVEKTPLIFAVPINHILRAICFESSDLDRRSFYVWAFFQPLFVPTSHVSFNLGFRVRNTEGAERWNADAPRLITELGQALQSRALPFFRSAGSPGDAAKAATSLETSNPHVQETIAYCLAWSGEAEEAIAMLNRLIIGLDLEVAWQREMADRARTMKSKLVGDPAEGQRQLESWEAQTIRNLGLEAFPNR